MSFMQFVNGDTFLVRSLACKAALTSCPYEKQGPATMPSIVTAPLQRSLTWLLFNWSPGEGTSGPCRFCRRVALVPSNDGVSHCPFMSFSLSLSKSKQCSLFLAGRKKSQAMAVNSLIRSFGSLLLSSGPRVSQVWRSHPFVGHILFFFLVWLCFMYCIY